MNIRIPASKITFMRFVLKEKTYIVEYIDPESIKHRTETTNIEDVFDSGLISTYVFDNSNVLQFLRTNQTNGEIGTYLKKIIDLMLSYGHLNKTKEINVVRKFIKKNSLSLRVYLAKKEELHKLCQGVPSFSLKNKEESFDKYEGMVDKHPKFSIKHYKKRSLLTPVLKVSDSFMVDKPKPVEITRKEFSSSGKCTYFVLWSDKLVRKISLEESDFVYDLIEQFEHTIVNNKHYYSPNLENVAKRQKRGSFCTVE